MKKTVNFRFSAETLSQLDRISEGTTRTAILEKLILTYDIRLDDKRKARATAGQANDQWMGPDDYPIPPAKPPVQDISATKKIVERPAKPGRPQQGKTTLTGRPFGAVPK